MSKIKSFNSYIKNEELFHGQPSGYGESGLDWLDNAFEWLGDKSGNKVDILNRSLRLKVRSGELDEKKAVEIAKSLLTKIGDKSRDEIQQMIDSAISSSNDTESFGTQEV